MTLVTPRSMDRAAESILALHPGRVTELVGDTGLGLTRLGLRLLAGPSARAPVVVLDVKGWLSPLAAWEVGVDPARLIVVRCSEPSTWAQVAAVIMEGVRAVYAEVPGSVPDQHLRRLAALARARKTGVALRPLGEGGLPSGVAHLRLQAVGVRWEGAGAGHGRLERRHLVVEASGRGMGGMTRRVEVMDDGADAVRVVSGVGAPEAGRVAG